MKMEYIYIYIVSEANEFKVFEDITIFAVSDV